MATYTTKTSGRPSREENELYPVEVSERELNQPLNKDWRYDSRWMADPHFRTWLVVQRRKGEDV